jgi:hypothetical protein
MGNLSDPFAILLRFKTQLNVPFFTEIMVSMSWPIWTIRNDNNFRGRPISIIQRCKDISRRNLLGLFLEQKRNPNPYFVHDLQHLCSFDDFLSFLLCILKPACTFVLSFNKIQ